MFLLNLLIEHAKQLRDLQLEVVDLEEKRASVQRDIATLQFRKETMKDVPAPGCSCVVCRDERRKQAMTFAPWPKPTFPFAANPGDIVPVKTAGQLLGIQPVKQRWVMRGSGPDGIIWITSGEYTRGDADRRFSSKVIGVFIPAAPSIS